MVRGPLRERLLAALLYSEQTTHVGTPPRASFACSLIFNSHSSSPFSIVADTLLKPVCPARLSLHFFFEPQTPAPPHQLLAQPPAASRLHRPNGERTRSIC
jgi:hypothetical protein